MCEFCGSGPDCGVCGRGRGSEPELEGVSIRHKDGKTLIRHKRDNGYDETIIPGTFETLAGAMVFAALFGNKCKKRRVVLN